MSQQAKKKIDGKEYTLIKMGTKASIKMMSRLTKLVDTKSDSSGMANMLISLISNPDVLPIIEDLLSDMTCDHKPIDFDNHFAEYRKDLLPCISFSLSESIVPFFDPDSLTQMVEMIASAMEASLADV